MITAGTLHKARLFNTAAKLDVFRDTTLQLIEAYSLSLRAWAFFANHYHLIVGFEHAQSPLRRFIRHVHREVAVRLNELDSTPRRKVMYQFWDTALTFEKSYFARLHYVHHNPVHHGLVAVAADYPWCSARWFETNARPASVRTVYSFKIDTLNVPDQF